MANTTAIDPTLLIEELGSELRALAERVAQLEAGQRMAMVAPNRAFTSITENASQVASTTAPEPVSLRAVSPETISEDILLVISAAVAAFLGERAHVRQVRLIKSPAWAQQGRVSIQASHHLQYRS